MAGFGVKEKWEASCITNNDIEDLKRAGYLSANIAHRAPEEGQVVLMTHNYRGSIIVLSISKSVEPNKE